VRDSGAASDCWKTVAPQPGADSMQLSSSRIGLPPNRRKHVGWVRPAVGVALWVIFELDRRTGSAPVQHLYYLPIILASFQLGRGNGLVAALAAIVLYHIANLSHFTASYTDTDVVQTVLFLVVAIVTAKLASDRARLHELAVTDDLTGLHNLRSFEAHLAGMVRASRESRAPLAMLVADVDRLKAMNDAHGHLAGAEAVRLVGRTIAAHLPPDAVACRYGGDEFAVAVANCDSRRAELVAEDLRRVVQLLEPVLAGVRFPVGSLAISVGLASLGDRQGSTAAASDEFQLGESLFAAADEALYAAKQQGRNRVGIMTMN
jgi:diguanylate cyclase (GGDEF)-like protein